MAKIAIDAGHGLYTSGKRCLARLDPNQTREWVLNDRVADALGMYLQSAGHQILRVDDTDGSSDISLASRVSKANSWGADFYMACHHDAGIDGGTGGGTTVLVYPSCSTKSRQAQESIYKHVIARTGLKGNRSDGTRSSNLYVLRETKMPACLIENGFMDSATDIKYILNPEWSKLAGLGIAEGICAIFGGKVNVGAAAGTKPKDNPNYTYQPAIKEDNDKEELTVDGLFGVDTTRKSQKVMGTPIDGVVSGQLVSCREYLPNALSSSWEFVKTSDGSPMIRAIQVLVGARPDGKAGEETVTKMQEFLNAHGFECGRADGIMGPKTVMAWQRYINSRL